MHCQGLTYLMKFVRPYIACDDQSSLYMTEHCTLVEYD